jgi:hypothetical protein
MVLVLCRIRMSDRAMKGGGCIAAYCCAESRWQSLSKGLRGSFSEPRIELKKDIAIDSRNMRGMTRPRIRKAFIMLGSISALARRGWLEAYHHTALSSSLVMARLPA